MKKNQSINLLITFLFTELLLISCGNAPPDVIIEKEGQTGLIFVRENSRFNNRSNPMRSNVDEYYPGTDLILLSPIAPSGNTKNLTKEFTREGQTDENRYGHAADPEISFDAEKVLFSMKKNRNSNWHLFEMNVDGTELVQLTDQSVGHDMDPAYLPNGQIVFTSTRTQIVDEYEQRESPLLHVADRDPGSGVLTNIRQISFNQSHETNPMVHTSGKIYFSRWEHLGNPNKFSIFTINPDGTRLFVLYGNHFPSQSGSRVYLDPRELGDGGLVSSLMERNSPFEGGAIAIKDLNLGDSELEIITPDNVPFNNTNQDTDALFRSPFPIYDYSNGKEEKLLVSISPIPVFDDMQDAAVDYGIYLMDKNGNDVRFIYNNSEYNDIDGVPVLPRDELPVGIPQVIESEEHIKNAIAEGQATGIFFDGNVYDRDPADNMLRPDAAYLNKDGSIGQAKYVRVLAAVPMPRNRDNRGGEKGNTNLEKERVVGYGNIRADGSFSIEVPANKALHLQTLDENGMMLVSQRSWTQVMPGEKRLCTGCHDSHSRDQIISQIAVQTDDRVTFNGAPYNSGFHNSENVQSHAAAKNEIVDFFDRTDQTKTNTIQNIFDNKCISCHSNTNPDGGLSLQLLAQDLILSDSDNGNSATTVYERLTDGDNYLTAENENMDYVTRNGARRSPLMWVMHNLQLDDETNEDYRTSSYDHRQIWYTNGNGLIDPFNQQNEDLLKLIEWIDMGIQYSNSILE